MDAKDELIELLGLDLKPGDKLRRINLPDGWPQQTLTVVKVMDREEQPAVHCICDPCVGATADVTIFLKNIGVLYERVGSNEHEQTSKNHPDPTRTERGKR